MDEKEMIIQVVSKNEDERGESTYKISLAGTKKSGFSVGRLQTDKNKKL